MFYLFLSDQMKNREVLIYRDTEIASPQIPLKKNSTKKQVFVFKKHLFKAFFLVREGQFFFEIFR